MRSRMNAISKVGRMSLRVTPLIISRSLSLFFFFLPGFFVVTTRSMDSFVSTQIEDGSRGQFQHNCF